MRLILTPKQEVCRTARCAAPRRAFLAGTTLAAALLAQRARADEPATIDPRAFGLDLPPGRVSAGDGRRVTTNDEQGAAVVAKLHVDVGEHRLVLLPDGHLVARPLRDAPITERPFVPITKAELAKKLLAGRLAGFKTKESRRYLYVYNTTENFALVTSKILESMFPGIVNYYETQRFTLSSPDAPLVVLMFRTEGEFQAYQKMPPGVVAYYNVLTNHVVMYEESKLFRVKPELGIQQSLSTIAHEGVHQILHNIGVQQRLSAWPMWISEGLAEYFAPTSVGKKLQWKGAGQVNDLRMYELENFLKSQAADAPAGQMVTHTVGAARLTSTGYASAWALTTYLAKQERAKFNRYVREISELGPLQGNQRTVGRGAIPENIATFQKYFGDDTADLEKKLVTYLKRLPYDDPFAEWPHQAAFVATVVSGKPKREANIFHSPELAERWQRETLSRYSAAEQQVAKSSIQEFANRQQAERAATEFLRGK
jgi:hypothetical protein